MADYSLAGMLLKILKSGAASHLWPLEGLLFGRSIIILGKLTLSYALVLNQFAQNYYYSHDINLRRMGKNGMESKKEHSYNFFAYI